MSVSPITTFGVFKNLLTQAVNNDSTLSSAVKSSMLARLNELPREVGIALDFSTVESVAGFVSVSQITRSVEVAIGASGSNRATWGLLSFGVPLTIGGMKTAAGFFAGNTGASANTPVAIADVALEYRLSATDSWKSFDRNTVLYGVTAIQFAAAIADQVAAVALPGLHLGAVQE